MDFSLIGAIGSAGVLAAMGCVIRRKLNSTVRLLSCQGILLAAGALSVGILEHSTHMFVAAFLALAVKGLIVPAMIGRFARKVDASREPHGIGTTRAAVLASGLTLMVYLITPKLDGLAGQLLAPSLTMIMLGFLLIVGRRLAVSQVIGLVTMENGVFLAAIGLTYGVPLVVELGIMIDLLVGLGVMGVLISRMHETLSTTDTSHLRHLKG